MKVLNSTRANCKWVSNPFECIISYSKLWPINLARHTQKSHVPRKHSLISKQSGIYTVYIYILRHHVQTFAWKFWRSNRETWNPEAACLVFLISLDSNSRLRFEDFGLNIVDMLTVIAYNKQAGKAGNSECRRHGSTLGNIHHTSWHCSTGWCIQCIENTCTYHMPFVGEEGDRVRRRETAASQSWNQEATVRMVCGMGPCGGRSSIQKASTPWSVAWGSGSITDAVSSATYSLILSCIGQGQFNHKIWGLF